MTGPAEAAWRKVVAVVAAFIGARSLALAAQAMADALFAVEPLGAASLGRLLAVVGVGAVLLALGRWTSRLWFRGAEASLGLWAIGGLIAAVGEATAEAPAWQVALSLGLVSVVALLAAAALEVRYGSR